MKTELAILLGIISLVGISLLMYLWGKDIQVQIQSLPASQYVADRITRRIERLEGLKWKNREKTTVLKESFDKKFGHYIKK